MISIKKQFFIFIFIIGIFYKPIFSSNSKLPQPQSSDVFDQEIQELFGYSTQEYEPCALKVIKKFWAEIKESKLYDQTQPKDSLFRIHRLVAPNGLITLFNLAIQTKAFIENKNPSKEPYNVYSLGQSAAWLVEMMKLLDFTMTWKQKKLTPDTYYDFIAFSGTIGTVTQNQKLAYKNYISSFLPKNKDLPSFILEFPLSGKSLCSFFNTFRTDLGQIFHNPKFLITPNENFNTQDYLLLHRNSLIPGYSLDFFNKKELNKFIYPLQTSDRFDDRLVMSYKPWEWETKNPLTFKLSPSAKLLRKILYFYIQFKQEEKLEPQ